MIQIALPRSWPRLVPYVLTGVAVLAGTLVVLAATAQAAGPGPNSTVISTGTADPEVPFEAFDANPPKLYDVDGNGVEEIVTQNDNQWVYVFDSITGEILFETRTWTPSYWGARPLNGPEVSVMRQDGDTHLIVANSAAVVTSFRFDANASTPSNFTFDKEWQRRLDGCTEDPAMDAKPVLADLDEDGRLEILGATEERGLYALHDDGRLFWQRCIGGGNGAPRVADLDQDGSLDVVHGSDAGFVTALEGATGDWMWGVDLREHFDLGTASIPVSPGIGQLDGEHGPDVVVGARDSHDTDNWTANHALLAALSSRGELLWSFQDPLGNPLTYTRPVVVDADEHNRTEVYWADWNTIGHKPPPPDDPDAWMVTGPANFYRLNASGGMVWRTQLDTYWSNKDLAVADVTGDGRQDVLANGPDDYDGIWYLDATTGDRQTHVSTHPWKVSRGPVVSDLRGNGTTQWIVPVEAATPEVSGGAILVHDTGVPFDAAWPHLPDPEVPPPPEEANGTFNATFRVHDPNEWWQELTVDPATPQTIAKVQVRVDGGAWLSMSKSSWGPWTSSHHTPEGAQVSFRAENATGAVSQSLPFTWLNGTLERPSTEPGDAEPAPDPFTPTYTVASGVNEWWIEVRVDSSDIVEHVDARVDNGSWFDLSRTSWGTWATSRHVDDGALVEFRATNAQGQTNTSVPYRWPDGEPAPNGSEPAPPENFTASFDPTDGVNEWWVEATVDANAPLAGVDARVDGGTWRPLDETDWGTWANSFHVSDGSLVEFRATSADGNATTSGAYQWPDGEPVDDEPEPSPEPDPDPTPSEPADLDVAFAPKASNEWWVETHAVANSTIASVQARADGGPWHELTLRDWGAWAGSFHAPAGTQIEFRAENGTGARGASAAFLWPDAVPADEPDASWPHEGSYAFYELFDGGPTHEFSSERNATFVYHDDRWVVRCEGHVEDPGGRRSTFQYTEHAPPLGPTNVTPGDRVDVQVGGCTRSIYDVFVRQLESEDVHREGDAVTVSTWFASRTDPCNCLAWEAEWETTTGLATDWWRGGREVVRGDLQDTDAPVR